MNKRKQELRSNKLPPMNNVEIYFFRIISIAMIGMSGYLLIFDHTTPLKLFAWTLIVLLSVCFVWSMFCFEVIYGDNLEKSIEERGQDGN